MKIQLKLAAFYRWLLLLAFTIIAGTTFAGPANEQSTEQSTQQSIRSVFDQYKKSVIAKAGSSAAKLVNQATLDYYASIRELALTKNATEVRQRSFSQKMLILTLRIRMTEKELRSMDGKRLFVHAVNNGWISKNSVEGATLGEIRITGDSATSTYVKEKQPQKAKFAFVKEADQWKFDLVYTMQQVDHIFRGYAKSKNLNEDDMVVTLVERATGKQVTQSIWDGYSINSSKR